MHRPPKVTRRAAGAGVLATALLLAACGGDDGGGSQQSSTSTSGSTTSATTAVTTTTAAPATTAAGGTRVGPEGDAFYTPPDPLPGSRPGDIIWVRPIAEAPAGLRGWRILYRSETVKGEPIAVSGVLAAPEKPAGPLNIIAVAHGTTGLGDQCAPSKRAAGGLGDIGFFPPEVLASNIVVATDYEGLGTPGIHTYVVGLAEGRNVLDSIRAAQRFEEAGATAQSKSVAWGHSQGGGAALLTAELAGTYAPDANLVGASAGAPASELKLLGTALRTSPYFGYLFMASAGFHAAYPEVDLSTVLTPQGIGSTEKAGGECSSDTIEAHAGKDANLYIKADPGATEPFASILEENSPGVRKTAVPVFVYHGEADEQIPVLASQLVQQRYCANGSQVVRKTYPGETHGSVITAARAEIIQYLQDRLAGKPAPSATC